MGAEGNVQVGGGWWVSGKSGRMCKSNEGIVLDQKLLFSQTIKVRMQFLFCLEGTLQIIDQWWNPIIDVFNGCQSSGSPWKT